MADKYILICQRVSDGIAWGGGHVNLMMENPSPSDTDTNVIGTTIDSYEILNFNDLAMALKIDQTFVSIEDIEKKGRKRIIKGTARCVASISVNTAANNVILDQVTFDIGYITSAAGWTSMASDTVTLGGAGFTTASATYLTLSAQGFCEIATPHLLAIGASEERLAMRIRAYAHVSAGASNADIRLNLFRGSGATYTELYLD